MKTLLIVIGMFIFLFFYKLILNYHRYRRIVHLYDLYKKSLDDKYDNIELHKNEIDFLLSKANVQQTVHNLSKSSLQCISREHRLSMDLLRRKDETVIQDINNLFLETIGVYNNRKKECFYPNYWVRLVLCLPEILIKMVGVDIEYSYWKIIARILNFTWWLLMILLVCFREPFLDYIQRNLFA